MREAEGERIKSWVEGMAADAGRGGQDMIPGESGGEGAVAVGVAGGGFRSGGWVGWKASGWELDGGRKGMCM